MSFRQELDDLVELARENSRNGDAIVRQELMRSYIGLEIMRFNQLRMLTALAHDSLPGPEQSIGKLFWSTWHRQLGELAMLVSGAGAMVADSEAIASPQAGNYALDRWQRTFLYSRAHTIYGGSNQVQRNCDR